MAMLFRLVENHVLGQVPPGQGSISAIAINQTAVAAVSPSPWS